MAPQISLWLTEQGGSFSVGPTIIPSPGRGEILVKIHSIGLNPDDWKLQECGLWIERYPTILGHEVAGTVEAVGEGVSHFVKGDRVFSATTAGTDNRKAAFQQYSIAPASLAVKLPANVSFDEAAGLSVGIATATIPLYTQPTIGLGYQSPWNGGRKKYKGQPIIVLGGSSCVGQYVIQFARLSGFSPIITTASPHNKTHLKSLGATYVIDRNLPFSAIAREISKLTAARIKLVFDAVSQDETQQGGYDLLAPGGRIIITLPSTIDEGYDDKQVIPVTGNFHIPENLALGTIVSQNLPALLASGDIRPVAVEVVPGGLNGIGPGLKRLKHNLVSAKKLVVHPWETA
ncbi:chaperonin 10-like protein [Hygrophoropsis aurantiaca]|uniref:Chaperonin 10-like protein n=1 Tax=Hygrophoropsis aurantiaca TaxID=72124 RepID=A0ACB8A2D9_9AGAM|nr:chaperonin 10-like protein [Hygrophoropsis aurantiaca]